MSPLNLLQNQSKSSHSLSGWMVSLYKSVCWWTADDCWDMFMLYWFILWLWINTSNVCLWDRICWTDMKHEGNCFCCCLIRLCNREEKHWSCVQQFNSLCNEHFLYLFVNRVILVFTSFLFFHWFSVSTVICVFVDVFFLILGWLLLGSFI